MSNAVVLTPAMGSGVVSGLYLIHSTKVVVLLSRQPHPMVLDP